MRWSPRRAAGIAKDVWVVSEHPIVPGRPAGVRVRGEAEHLAAPVDAATAAMVPRVLADLFWFGRYAERAEDLLRLILATRTVAIETDMDTHLRAGARRCCCRPSPGCRPPTRDS